jgi:hypothetical protein
MHGIAKARGQLFHHFHGSYWAQILLWFETEEHAAAAARVLGKPWQQSNKTPSVLGCALDSAALDAEKRKLGRFGADVKAIDSLRKSVDCGEPFSVDVPLLPPATRPEGWGREFGDTSGAMVQLSLLGGP